MLAHGADELVAVGDPDQSIYAFRGSDPAAIRRFGESFAPASGEPVPVVALSTSRRSGATLLPVHPADRRPAARAAGAPRAERRSRARRRGASRCTCCARPARRRRTWRTGCAPRTCWTGCRGGTWRCWSGPPSGTCRRCAGRLRSPACPPRWPATRCRWSPSRRCCRSCGCWTARCGGCGPTTPGGPSRVRTRWTRRRRWRCSPRRSAVRTRWRCAGCGSSCAGSTWSPAGRAGRPGCWSGCCGMPARPPTGSARTPRAVPGSGPPPRRPRR